MHEVRSDHIDPLVGALGREDDRNQKTEGRIVVEFRFSHGHSLLEVGDYLVVEFFLAHCVR